MRGRASLAARALACALACALVTASAACKKERVAPSEPPGLSASAAPSAVAPLPTTPPVATFDDAAPAGQPSGSTLPPMPHLPGNVALERARAAALNGNYREVRSLLETRVRTGTAAADEARLVKEACKQMHDQACIDDIKAKYP